MRKNGQMDLHGHDYGHGKFFKTDKSKLESKISKMKLMWALKLIRWLNLALADADNN